MENQKATIYLQVIMEIEIAIDDSRLVSFLANEEIPYCFDVAVTPTADLYNDWNGSVELTFPDEIDCSITGIYRAGDNTTCLKWIADKQTLTSESCGD